MSLAESELEKSGTISNAKGIGFQTYDVTSQQLAGVVNGAQYTQMAENLQNLGYKLDEQTEIAVTSEGNLNSYTKDWKIVQYLLQQILDTEKDQLEGFYNFPADMFPYIPVTNGLLSTMQGGGTTTNITLPETIKNKTFEEMYPETGAGIGGGVSFADTTPTKEAGWKSFWKDKLDIYSDWGKPTTDKTFANQSLTDKLLNPPEVTLPENIATSVSSSVTSLQNIENTIKEIFSILTGTQTNKPNEEIIPKDMIELVKGNALQQSTTQLPSVLSNTGLGTGFDFAALTGSITSAMANFTMTSLKNLTTRLSLNINNRTVLQVNGRVLAEIVRPYLKDELVRYSNGVSTISANAV
jgi:hypothetical protein